MNKVFIIGRLVSDVFIDTKGQNVKCYGTIVVDNGKDREADFIPFVAFGKTAELIADNYKKGSPIAIEGRVSIKSENVGTNRNREYKTYANVILNKLVFIPTTKNN